MSSIELKLCPFCGCIPKIVKYTETPIHRPRERRICFSPECLNEDCVIYRTENSFSSKEEAAEAWNRRFDNKSNRQSCKNCKYYTPDPGYRDGDMGNCQYLEKIWEKPFYVNEARTECEHFQVAGRSDEHGNGK